MLGELEVSDVCYFLILLFLSCKYNFYYVLKSIYNKTNMGVACLS